MVAIGLWTFLFPSLVKLVIEALLKQIACILENIFHHGFGEGEDGSRGSGDLSVTADWQMLFETSKPALAQITNTGATDIWVTDDKSDIVGGIIYSHEASVFDRYKGRLYVRGAGTVNWKIFKVH